MREIPRSRKRARKRIPRLGRQEADQKVIELYNDGATYPEIASETHRSATTIKEIIDSYESHQVPAEESKRSAALRLLNRGGTFLSVAIKLDLSRQQVEDFYLDLTQLKGMTDFVGLYDQVKNALPNFIEFYNLCKSRGLTIYEVEKIKNLNLKCQDIEFRLSLLRREIQNTQNLLDRKVQVVNALDKQERDLKSNIFTLSNQSRLLEQEISRSQSILDFNESQEAYQKIEKIIEDNVTKILNNESELLENSLTATFLTLQKFPILQELLYSLSGQFPLGYLLNEFQMRAQPILNTLRSRIHDLAHDNIHNDVEKLANGDQN